MGNLPALEGARESLGAFAEETKDGRMNKRPKASEKKRALNARDNEAPASLKVLNIGDGGGRGKDGESEDEGGSEGEAHGEDVREVR
jgi:hypothetical protein